MAFTLILPGLLTPIHDIKAASCVLQGNTITVSCDFAPGTYYYNGTFTVNAGVTVTAGNVTNPGLVTIIADDFVIDGAISANGVGNGGGGGTCRAQPPPGGTDGNGGCHAGYGGKSPTFAATTNVYGSATEPVDIGSGGGDDNATTNNDGGPGGGAIKLATYSATGTATFGAAGSVTANGSNGAANQGGGGSGGSVWIDVGILDVDGGTVSANGGNGGTSTVTGGGGGGGGRVAIHFSSVTGTFTQTRQAFGGNRGTTLSFGAQPGGAGTVFVWDKDDPTGDLIIDNNNLQDSPFTKQTPGLDYSVANLTIRNDARYLIGATNTLSVSAGGTVTGGGAFRRQPQLWILGLFNAPSEAMTIAGLDIHHTGTIGNLRYLTFDNGVYSVDTTSALFDAGPGDRLESLVLSGTGTTTFSATGTSAFFVDTFQAKSNSYVTHATNTSATSHTLYISATSSIDIDSGATVNVNGRGFSGGACNNVGQGTGGGTRQSGGSHGGDGGAGTGATSSSAAAYGSATSPSTIGSGGGGATTCGFGTGGNGAGAARLSAPSGTVTLGGTITANGTAGSGGNGAGGGAGGSVFIDTATLAGSGSIDARGGAGSGSGSTTFGGGGGGGGRIAITYASGDPLTMTLQANGGVFGSVGNSGGAGTIFYDDTDDASPNGALILDNNNNASSETSSQTVTTLNFDFVTVRNGAKYGVPSGRTFTLPSGGTVTKGGSVRPGFVVRGGGTLNANTSNWSVVGFDVDNSGTLSGPTQLQFRGSRLSLRGNGKFFTPVTDLDMQTDSNLDQESTDPNFDLTSLTIPAGSTVTRTGSSQPFGPNFMNLTVNGTYVDASALELLVDTMTINSGGLVTHATNTSASVQGQQLIISATTSISVLAGGSINVNGKGFQGTYSAGNGPGAGPNGGPGGSYGGNGAAGGGSTYGSATAPTSIGSSGSGHNGFSSNGLSGAGGGAVKLTAGGTVLVAGTINAGAVNGAGYSGGGSGGSIWIDAGTLTGGGAITANGGTGGISGGGGGGGRLALYYNTDSGTGTRSAYGAFGSAGTSGAGTVFLDDKDDAQTNGTLVVNNNNQSGAATTQTTPASQTYDSVDIRNAANYVVPSGHTLTIASGGTLVGSGTTRGTLTVNSGGTFDPGAASFTFNQANVTNAGTIANITNLTVVGSTTTLSGAGTFSATLTSLDLRSATFTQGSSNPGMIVTSLAMYASTYNNNSTNTGLALANLQIPSGSRFNNNSSAYFPLGSSFGDLTVYGTYSEGVIRRLFVDDLVVHSGGLVMHATNVSLTAQDKALDISATSSISILAGGAVSAAGRGFPGDSGAGNGPGATGAGGMGPGHGGNGGALGSAGGVSYGSATSPATIGSSGSEFNGLNGTGGAGGGAIRLATSGTLLMAGTLSAAATNGSGYGAGGAGGSIWLDADTLTGGSAITVNGGNHGGSPAAGGAGGRIALYYNTDSSTGTRTAYGGAGAFGGQQGGAGTIFLDDKNDALANGSIIVHNNNISGAVTTQVNGLAQSYDSVTIQAGANYVIPSGNTLSVASSSALTVGGSTRPTITVNSGGTLDLNTANLNLQNVNITNAGTMPDVTTLTYGAGIFTHSGTFSAGLTDLTVQSGANFIHATTSQLFSGSDLTVENGGIFTQSSSSTLDITTVLVKSGGTITSGDNTTTHAYGVNISSTTFTIEPAGRVITDALGFDSTTGDGQGGDGTAGGGAGYGGGGGRGVVSSVAQGTAGVTYGSATSPDKLGSGGGDDTNNANQQGGAGGGSIILTVTGTFTQNGDVSADGQNGTANEGGGGSGGSVWLTLGSWTGSGTSTITAIGGTGNGNDTTGGGCGGGGRISISYAGKTYTGGAPSAAAGSGCTGLRAATAGTLVEEQTGGPPVNGSIVINPSSPEVGQNVVFSATSTDDDGVAKMEFYLDGLAPGNLVKTCLFSPIQTPASCQHVSGSLAVGSHSVTVISYDGFDATDSDTLNFSVAGRTGGNSVDLSTYKKSATAVFSLSFTLSATSTGTLTVTFPSEFTVNSAATSGSGCLSSFGFGAGTLTATKTACTGTVTMTGATVVNPSVAGNYTITWTNDNGSAIVTIVDDDSFNISASVDPVLTFNVGSQAAASSCDGSFAAFGGTIALGTLTTSAVGSSDVSSVPHICTRLSTNAPGGAVVTVRSQNASLASTSSPGDTIPSSSTTLVSGTAGYGLCGGSGGSDTGLDSTTPAGAAPARSSPFNGSCSTSSHAVGALTTSPQTVWSVTDPTQNAFVRIFIKAAISSGTPPHTDYTDVLTFIATATY